MDADVAGTARPSNSTTVGGVGGELVRFFSASAALSRQRDERALLSGLAVDAADLCGAGVAAVVVRNADLVGWDVAGWHGSAVDHLLDEAIRLLGDAPDTAGDASVGMVTGSAAHDLLVAPISTVVGRVAAIVITEPRRAAFEDRDRQLLWGLALHAGVALENARLHHAARHEIASRQAALEERDAVARVLQQSLLPPRLPTIAGLDVAATYLPMTEGIGGDFYDVFPLRGRDWGVVLGDVCGKGPEAAAVTALARHTVHTASMTHRKPGRALEMLNELLVEQRENERSSLCTALFARLRIDVATVQMTAAVAGHPPPVILRRDGSLDIGEPTGPLLGLFSHIDVRQTRTTLGPGDACVLYTDGATDVQGRDGVFGEERLFDVIAGCRGMHAGAIASSIERAVVDFQDGATRDDLALIVLAVPPFG